MNKWTADRSFKRFLNESGEHKTHPNAFATERAASDNNGFIIQFHSTSYNNIIL